ncbi:MAG: hypothetical protein U5J99_07990 [Parvularculaceae bacterium]|nr:hypothetical protein [Parvularculaceae bacterium]
MNGRSFTWAMILSGVVIPALSACSTRPALDRDKAYDDLNAARISDGLARLGASADRSNCFGDKIAEALSGAEAIEAIEIVEASTSKDDMRNRVLGASAPVKQSFIRAHFGCSFFR